MGFFDKMEKEKAFRELQRDIERKTREEEAAAQKQRNLESEQRREQEEHDRVRQEAEYQRFKDSIIVTPERLERYAANCGYPIEVIDMLLINPGTTMRGVVISGTDKEYGGFVNRQFGYKDCGWRLKEAGLVAIVEAQRQQQCNQYGWVNGTDYYGIPVRKKV